MKKFSILISWLLVIFGCCCLTACNDNKQPEPLIITAQDSSFDFGNKTLKDYMEYLQSNKHFTFTVSNGMVTAINGTSNTTNSYWMLYTSDSEYANAAWGTFDNNGNVYGSATLGYRELPIKENCVYVWAYLKF